MMNHAPQPVPPNRQTIAVTMGDPAGIGPEIIVKALADPNLRQRARFLIFGLNEHLIHAADQASIDPYWRRLPRAAYQGYADDPKNAPALLAEDVLVIDDDRFPEAGLTLKRAGARPTKVGGAASLGFLRDALQATQHPAEHSLRVNAVATAPISKSSWHLAGMKRFPGHTELIADFAKAKRHAMMFVAPELKLRVVLATIHIPLMDVRNVMTIGRVFDPIDLANDACRDLLHIQNPRIAVCGLNPHASEGGLFGDEEYRVITPAIRQAREVGINIEGPFPADTIYNSALAGKYDVVIAMYHDQGTIPIKLLARDNAVNMTIGLPFVRTSPDHGTAFDIAGKNVAECGSMRAALTVAVESVERQFINARIHE